MSEFIENLRVRQQDAHRRLQAAQQRLAVAQAEFQAASQDFNSWNYALATETRKAQQEAATALAARLAGHSSPPSPTPDPVTAVTVVTTPVTPAPIANVPEVNKTELVRNVLRQHTSGLTPNEIWKELKNQVGYAYIYSILKRLRDNEQITKKRGKYCLKNHQQLQPDEVTVQNGIIQQH